VETTKCHHYPDQLSGMQ